jgi:hypothetical protein
MNAAPAETRPISPKDQQAANHTDSADLSSVLYERADWTLFRSLQTTGQRAGIPVKQQRRLVVKELVDNAPDSRAECALDADVSNGAIRVWIAGPGIPETLEAITDLFSIRRPLRSSKIRRIPQRGALGNGLRVVAGAVLASSATSPSGRTIAGCASPAG